MPPSPVSLISFFLGLWLIRAGTSVKFDLRRFSSRLSQDVNQKARSRRLRYEFIKRAGARRYKDG
ncbi:hypothetical protein CAMRE0001_0354 [Campylobacter rectus RM3267]|uniref:Uncharacterized protein n=1 Tax=Campylobacter rectus RM3267 TaxID=553218 RepID=B9D2C9_CAMRE|nr:hypothetical protein CAMRE0001_0354 [Campylobacter rectus RM3267]